MRAELHHKTTVGILIPRGRDGYWEIIRKLQAENGGFTVKDIDQESNVGAGDIRTFVRLLLKAGFIAHQCSVYRRGAQVPHYVVVKDQKATPRIRANGSVIVSTMQENLWTAIRNLKSFTLKELVFAATTDEVAVTHAFAKRFTHRLTTAGYLTVVVPHAGRHRVQTWRLKPGMNTGPKPPVPYRVDVLWDPNLRKEVGNVPIADEVAI